MKVAGDPGGLGLPRGRDAAAVPDASRAGSKDKEAGGAQADFLRHELLLLRKDPKNSK